LDTLTDTTSGHVADMTETCRRHVADTTQNVAIWAKKRHADIRHMELSQRVMLCMDSHLDPLLVLMIETPHPVHTHGRSSLYIYKRFQHLL